MQNFFDQIKVSLADSITYSTSAWPSRVYFELNYREYKIELEYCGSQRGAIGATFLLTIDLRSDLDLEILPKSFFDRLFDIQAGVSLFDTSKKIKIKIPLIEDELLVHTNNEDVARNLLALPDVGKIIYDYGINFFKIENGELKVFLDELSTEKFEELRTNPVLINRYLDIAVDLAGELRT